MNTIKDIERAIEQLSPVEFARLREWIAERDAQLWDEQIASDSASGRLKSLVDTALQEHRTGRSTPL